MDLESIDKLVERLRDSDHEAYQAVFQQMHEPLIRYVYRILKDEGRAMDVVQDVFMKLWEMRLTLDVKVSFRAMLYTMARNRAFNVNRNQSKMSYDSEQVELNLDGAFDTQIESKLHTEQLNRYIKLWVKEMPPRRSEAFTLSRFHALSHQEIGEIMGLSKRTVDTHIVHALRYLRSRYDQIVNI